jgi:hypothetical protein
MHDTTRQTRIIPRRFPPTPAPIDDLAFVSRTRVGHDYWRIPSLNGYDEACHLGYQYFADFVQYLKDNPGEEAFQHLIHIARDQHLTSGLVDVRHGVAISFWALVEKALFEWGRSCNVQDFAQRHADEAGAAIAKGMAECYGENVRPIRKEAA